MSLLSPAQTVTMLQRTGGDVVVDTAASESSYGHFDQVPVEVASGEYGQVITTEPSVVVAAGIFTNITARKGIGRALTVGGVSWVIRDITAADPDGGTIRLLLAEA
jgi:hypothetical protein